MTTPPDCPFCTLKAGADKFLLHETPLFRVVCDSYPLTEGHILIIPKHHVSCIGAYSPQQLADFKKLYQQFRVFIGKTYGSVSTFEHGIFGQTVFHSHVHLIPYEGTAEQIVSQQTAFKESTFWKR